MTFLVFYLSCSVFASFNLWLQKVDGAIFVLSKLIIACELGNLCRSKVGEGPEKYKAQYGGFMTTLWVGVGRVRSHQ